MYLNKTQHADPDALYIVSGGSNDAFFGLSDPRNVTQLAHDTVHALQAETRRLMECGARHVLVPTLSAMQHSPWARHYAGHAARQQTAAFTRAVNARLHAWTATRHAPRLLDVDGLERQISAHPGAYEIENVADACLVGTQLVERGVPRHRCSEPNRYFFFDLYHPTERVHNVLAHGAVRALTVRV